MFVECAMPVSHRVLCGIYLVLIRTIESTADGPDTQLSMLTHQY